MRFTGRRYPSGVSTVWGGEELLNLLFLIVRLEGDLVDSVIFRGLGNGQGMRQLLWFCSVTPSPPISWAHWPVGPHPLRPSGFSGSLPHLSLLGPFGPISGLWALRAPGSGPGRSVPRGFNHFRHVCH